MSHQNYRNWNILMEAELAVMQDCGLELDRRNFYGGSLYNDGVEVVNRNPYYARNAEGTGWLEGQYNPTAYGIGYHVYGSHNVIHQAADLLSSGAWGMGIRMDGVENTLSIGPGVRVHANGDGGNALLVAYGRNHHVINGGDLQALGEGGVAARFDFGSNELGDRTEMRGSGIRTKWDKNNEEWSNGPLLDALSGALVDSFDVTGRLMGEKAAIFISGNAYVGEINIMSGAVLSGDIISEWDQENPFIQVVSEDGLATELTFGRKADEGGMSTNEADFSFFLRYDGDVSGPSGINMNVAGGELMYNGRADVLSVTVAEHAILAGAGEYSVSDLVENRGTFSPGDGIGTSVVNGDFVQGKTGSLLIELDDRGNYDRLVVNGGAQMEGTLALELKRGYYRDTFSLVPLEVSDEFIPEYTLTCDPSSPTLKMTAREENRAGKNEIIVSASRIGDAYSQYAGTGNAQQTGRALDRIGADAPEGMRELFAALDFSSADGCDIRYALPRLSADAYGGAALAVLDMQRMVTDLVFAHSKTAGMSAEGKDFFIQPYTGGNNQPGSIGYKSYNIGMLGGVNRPLGDSVAWGAHAAFNYLSMNGDTNGKLDGDSFMLGGQLENSPDPGKLRMQVLVRAGVDQMRMKRKVAFSGYDASHSADWTGFSGMVRMQMTREIDLGPVMAGPLAALDYGLAVLPSVTEDGASSSRLDLDTGTYQSLRSRLGGQIAMKPLSLGAQSSWLARGLVAWNHEYLDRVGMTDASFAGAPGYGFSNKVKFPGRDSIDLEAGLIFDLSRSVSFLINGGSEIFMHGDNSLYGNASVQWRF